MVHPGSGQRISITRLEQQSRMQCLITATLKTQRHSQLTHLLAVVLGVAVAAGMARASTLNIMSWFMNVYDAPGRGQWFLSCSELIWISREPLECIANADVHILGFVGLPTSSVRTCTRF